jgi:streptogrisin C
MRKRERLVLASTAAAAVLAALALVPTQAHAVSPSIDREQVRGSLAYLQKAYRISESEALRRLQLQHTAQLLDRTLAARAASTYAGMWIDQEHGGTLVIASTAPKNVTGYLAGVPDRSHVSVAQVSRSLADLRTTRDRLAATLGDGPDSVWQPRVDEATNQVVLWQRDWVVAASPSVTALAAGAVARAVGAENGAAVVKHLAKPNPLFTPNLDVGYCHPLYCTGYGPMRGGIRLDIQRDDGTWGGCTSGFNIRAQGGNYAGVPFVLTGGHCVVGGRHQHVDLPYHNGTSVLREEAGLAVNNFPYDFAFMPYANAATQQTWLDGSSARNTVLAFCRNGGLDSDIDTPCTPGDIPITGMQSFEQVHSGYIVCASGAAASDVTYPDSWDSGAGAGFRPGTRCGRVTTKDVAINTDICARAGDSGGPLFSEIDNVGLGILEGNTQDREGPCQLGEENNYVALSTIFDYINAQPAAGGSTFGLITTGTG